MNQSSDKSERKLRPTPDFIDVKSETISGPFFTANK